MKKTFDYSEAWATIKLGLEHGAIKLQGSVVDSMNPEDDPVKRAQADAAYLTTLYYALQNQKQD